MSRLLLEPEDYEFYTGRKFDEDFIHSSERQCAYCGEFDPRTRDHIVPKSRGGADDPENIVPCCYRCNSKKGARTPEESGMPIIYADDPRRTK